jgi:predicted RNA-binding Zn-ribbon protein involved in translation (DUF1610 family)
MIIMRIVKFALIFLLWEVVRLLSIFRVLKKSKVDNYSPVECSRCGWVGKNKELPVQNTEEDVICPNCGATGWYLQTLN